MKQIRSKRADRIMKELHREEMFRQYLQKKKKKEENEKKEKNNG